MNIPIRFAAALVCACAAPAFGQAVSAQLRTQDISITAASLLPGGGAASVDLGKNFHVLGSTLSGSVDYLSDSQSGTFVPQASRVQGYGDHGELQGAAGVTISSPRSDLQMFWNKTAYGSQWTNASVNFLTELPLHVSPHTSVVISGHLTGEESGEQTLGVNFIASIMLGDVALAYLERGFGSENGGSLGLNEYFSLSVSNDSDSYMDYIWRSSGNLAAAVPVPEPATLPMLAAGLGVLGWLRRRRA
ncbi:MAG: PEP-CTERM sorting domain-containing protein [Telluria sp.]